MAHNIKHFEWVIGDDSWSILNNIEQRDPSRQQLGIDKREQRLALELLRGIGLLLLSTLLIAGASPSQRTVEQQQYQSMVGALLQLEKKAWAENDNRLFMSLIDPAIHADWAGAWRSYWRREVNERQEFGTHIRHIERENDLLFAQVVITRPPSEWWHVSPTRETRIYQNTGVDSGAGIQRTVPDASFWGEQQNLETENLRFEFSERDAPLMRAVSQELERIYRSLSNELGFRRPSNGRKLTIRLRPNARQGRAPSRSSSFAIDVTTPLLAQIPDNLSDQEHVVRFVTNQLTSMAVIRKMERSGTAYGFHWGMMVWATRGWLETDMIGTASPWFKQSEEVFRTYGQDQFPIELDAITAIRKRGESRDYDHVFWQYVASELVVDYAVSTYGRQAIPALLTGFSNHRSWNDLVATAFDGTTSEFEAGLNQYIAKKYGLRQQK